MLVHRCKWSVVYGVFTKVHNLFGGGGGKHSIVTIF